MAILRTTDLRSQTCCLTGHQDVAPWEEPNDDSAVLSGIEMIQCGDGSQRMENRIPVSGKIDYAAFHKTIPSRSTF